VEAAAIPAAAEPSAEESSTSLLVEIDLLLNYGMREKALQLLRSLEASRPKDKEVRSRLASLYRETGANHPAAEQFVILSALHRESGDAEGAKKSLEQAVTLAPDLYDAGTDVLAFAEEHGIKLDMAERRPAPRESKGGLEMDLSGDLSDIFFKDAQEPPDQTAAAETPELMPDEFAAEMPQPAPAETIEDQLQEVDFYIRLGFHDEARAKLDEIAAVSPESPALAVRYAQLGPDAARPSDAARQAPAEGERKHAVPPAEESVALKREFSLADFGEADSLMGRLEAAAAEGGNGGGRPAAEARMSPEEPDSAALPAAGPGENRGIPAVPPIAHREPGGGPPEPEAPANEMFVDLIEEVNSLTDREIARDDFETHFNLGTAFREMGLIEDAVREFQSAVKTLDQNRSPREYIQCCGMLSTCFLERGMPRSAIRWCRSGLSVREITSHESMALQYDMGIAHSAEGDSSQALECFGTVFGQDPTYRDVAQRIDDLKSGLERHAL
jgi:tetratricopeptide (TPR) repeat protein